MTNQRNRDATPEPTTATRTQHRAAKGAKDLVAEARAKVENLDVDAVAAQVEQGALLVDLREPGELREHGVIPGAIHVPRGMLEFHADPATPYHIKELDRSRPIILHCASGGRSALAAETLQQMGFEEIAHLDGGFQAWQAAGRPTAREP